MLLKTCCQQVNGCLQFISVPIEKEFKLVCQGKECNSSSDLHYLLPSPDGIRTSCDQKKRVYRNLTPEEAYWIPDANTPQGKNITMSKECKHFLLGACYTVIIIKCF